MFHKKTVKKQTQIKLSESRENYRLLVEHIPVGIIIRSEKKVEFINIREARNYSNFKMQIPIRDYESLKGYVNHIINGEKDVLWPGKPLYFCKTSGTTSGEKYIPISKKSMPNHITAARDAILSYVAETKNTSIVNGKMIFLQGSPKLTKTGDILTGRLSGIVAHHIPVYLTKVYNWMAVALLLTGLVAYFTAQSEMMIQAIFGNRILFFGLIIGELALVGYISARIHKLSSYNATLLFLAYTVLNGLTMAVIFLAYTSASIASTFMITAGTFGIMSIYGYFTKSDLTKIGNLAFMALIGIIIASVVNMFMQSEMMSWVISYLGVAIFIGLTAYDTQKLKRIAINGFENEESMEKNAILGALTLYLDFINLFLFLLRIFGDRK